MSDLFAPCRLSIGLFFVCRLGAEGGVVVGVGGCWLGVQLRKIMRLLDGWVGCPQQWIAIFLAVERSASDAPSFNLSPLQRPQRRELVRERSGEKKMSSNIAIGHEARRDSLGCHWLATDKRSN